MPENNVNIVHVRPNLAMMFLSLVSQSPSLLSAQIIYLVIVNYIGTCVRQ